MIREPGQTAAWQTTRKQTAYRQITCGQIRLGEFDRADRAWFANTTHFLKGFLVCGKFKIRFIPLILQKFYLNFLQNQWNGTNFEFSTNEKKPLKKSVVLADVPSQCKIFCKFPMELFSKFRQWDEANFKFSINEKKNFKKMCRTSRRLTVCAVCLQFYFYRPCVVVTACQTTQACTSPNLFLCLKPCSRSQIRVNR